MIRMKKSFLFALLFGSCLFAAKAQVSLSDVVWKGGFLYEFYNLTPTDSNYQDALVASGWNGQVVLPYYNFMFGGYLPLVHKKDIISAGVESGLQFGINFRQGISYQIQMPLYACARLGASSTVYNQQRVGIGVGIGGQFSFLHEARQILNSGEKAKNISVFAPSALIELNIGNGLIGRLHLPLFPVKTRIPAFDFPPTYTTPHWRVNNFGLGLIYRM